ncbi:unnamed protein product [Discosporangium mesarthrocarpum]
MVFLQVRACRACVWLMAIEILFMAGATWGFVTTLSATLTKPDLALTVGGMKPGVRTVLRPRAVRCGVLRMAVQIPAPPVKPPKQKEYGGDDGNEFSLKECDNQERLETCTEWQRFARVDGRERFLETIEILDSMLKWTTGLTPSREKRYTLACCRGDTIYALAAMKLGRNNNTLRGFFTQETQMTVAHLVVDPSNPKFKAGEFLLKQVKEMCRIEELKVDFTPMKEIYSGKFYDVVAR